MFRSAVRKKGPSEDSCICVMHLENKNHIQQTWLLCKTLIFFFMFFPMIFENLKSKYRMSKLFWKIYLIFSERLFGKKHWSHEQFKQWFMNNYPENDKLIMLKRRIFKVIKKKGRAHRVTSLSVCFPYLWTAVLVLRTRQFIRLRGTQNTVYFAFIQT